MRPVTHAFDFSSFQAEAGRCTGAGVIFFFAKRTNAISRHAAMPNIETTSIFFITVKVSVSVY